MDPILDHCLHYDDDTDLQRRLLELFEFFDIEEQASIGYHEVAAGVRRMTTSDKNSACRTDLTIDEYHDFFYESMLPGLWQQKPT